MAAILETIDTKGSLVTVLTGAEPKPPALLAPTTPPTPPPPTTSFDILLSTDKKTLSVTNTTLSLTIYIKLTSGDEILYSDTDEEGTYKKFFFQHNPTYPKDYFKDVMTTMGLIDATGRKTPEYQYLFGAVSSAKTDYYNYLKTDIGLEKTEPAKKKFNHKYPPNDGITVGWGMKNDDVPKHAHF